MQPAKPRQHQNCAGLFSLQRFSGFPSGLSSALKAADQDFSSEVANLVLPLFPEAQFNNLEAPIEALKCTFQQAHQKSECKAVSASKPQRDKYCVLNTQVQFECLLVKTSETWAEGIQRMARNKLGTAQEAARAPRCSFQLRSGNQGLSDLLNLIGCGFKPYRPIPFRAA